MSNSDMYWYEFWKAMGWLGFIVVFLGIVGEGAELLFKLAKEKKHKEFKKELSYDSRLLLAVLIKYIRPRFLKVEFISFSLVVFGLATEFWGGFKSGQYTDAEMESLLQQNIKLQIAAQKRIITDTEIKNFIFLTARIPKYPISVGVGNPLDETWNYAVKIRGMLNAAKFPIPVEDTNFIYGVRIDHDRLAFDSTIEDTNEWSDVDFTYNAATNLSIYGFGYEMTNGFCRPIIIGTAYSDTNSIYDAIYFIFNELKITVGQNSNPDWIKTNECEILVRQKP